MVTSMSVLVMVVVMLTVVVMFWVTMSFEVISGFSVFSGGGGVITCCAPVCGVVMDGLLVARWLAW